MPTFQERVDAIVDAKLRERNQRKEDLVTAWVCETGHSPSESVLVEQFLGTGETIWFVAHRDMFELPRANAIIERIRALLPDDIQPWDTLSAMDVKKALGESGK